VHSGSQAANGVITGLKCFLVNEKELIGYLPLLTISWSLEPLTKGPWIVEWRE